MPKFSFPMPGRRINKSKAKDLEISTLDVPSPALSTGNGSFSKAQRFFGTDSDLYIDSPTRDDDSWMVASSRSSVMSISISESTHSTRTTDDTASVLSSQTENGEPESATFPRLPRLNAKPSSTILGMRYGDGDESASNVSARLRSEDSSSTLKSYYDRQTSPLAISQQTSESSARDLALRKGLPTMMASRSPLLQVESAGFVDSVIPGRQSSLANQSKDPKKKPAKLDFSMLFPRPRNHGKSPTVASPSITAAPAPLNQPSGTPNSLRRKLTRALSKESLRSQHSARSIQPEDLKQLQTNGSPFQGLGRHQLVTHRPAQLDQIPEIRVPEQESGMSEAYQKPSLRTERPRRGRETQPIGVPKEHTLRSEVPCPWETASTTSASSYNTKNSKRVSHSVFSHADLQQKSVLSLSSDSEGEESDEDPIFARPTQSNDKASRILNGDPPGYRANSRLSTLQNGERSSKIHGQRDKSPQPSHSGSTSEGSTPNTRISRPRIPVLGEPVQFADPKRLSKRASARRTGNEQQEVYTIPKEVRQSVSQSRELRKSIQAQSRVSRKPSMSSQRSQRSSLQPTPPLSPSSVEFRADPEHSNRFMAVTKQEEALLEALRQKRANMRERLIEEHETGHRSPPRTAEEIKAARYSQAGTINTYPGSSGPSKETVLMVMDTPVSEEHRIYTAEPSPDLSDFLGLGSGSDEESTPRTSWVAAEPRRDSDSPRPDSIISPSPTLSPIAPTPASVARLSAVGFGFKEGRTPSVKKKKKKATPGVRFTDDTRSGSGSGSGVLDEEEPGEVIWGM